MIYVLYGNDTKKINIYLKKLYKNNLPIYIPAKEVNKEIIFNNIGGVSLFGEKSVVVVENVINNQDFSFSKEDLNILKEAKTEIIFLEEKLSAIDLKKYKDIATIENFSSSTTKKIPKVNVFNIAEAFSKRDKIGAWSLYREAVLLGVSPEEISGIIFWKIKTMILNNTKNFSLLELKKYSSELVSLYHRSHKGELDFTISLEQFILSSLSK